MKITTLNLQGFTDWQSRKPEIIRYLKETDPDVILFQEVVFLPHISPFNQAQELNQELGYQFEHSAVTRLQPSHEYDVFREGLAMLSKYPVAKTDTIVLKQEKGDEHNRILQMIDVVMGDQLILLANVHFSLTDDEDFATAHFKETLEIIQNKGEERIIAGDFNMDHLEDLKDIWGEQYNASVSVPYVSFPLMNKRNDYVMLPKPLDFKHIAVSGDGLSDHRAVTVQFDTLL